MTTRTCLSWLRSLLQPESKNGKPIPPFPWRQLLVLAACRLCEPIAFMSIFPYIYYMIKSFHITDNDQTIALYAGMVTSAFAFAEFLAGMGWGHLSDRFGRKPILLCGLAGTGISMIAFGFSTNLPMAMIARALGGLLNGNIGVLQTTVAEVVTVEEHRGIGFSIMPVVWCVGSIVGSVLGGALADPVRNYGWPADSIWAAYPFLLPNLVCTGVVVFGLVVGIFFLEETHEDKKDRRDPGLDMGRALMRLCTKTPPIVSSHKQALVDEEDLLVIEDDSPPRYQSAAQSPHLSPSFNPVGQPPPAYKSTETSPRHSLSNAGDLLLDSAAPTGIDSEAAAIKLDLSMKGAFTRQICLIIVSYGILAYHTISAEQLLPVMFSMPVNNKPQHPPFFFTGGYGWETKYIGSILSFQGVVQIVATLLIFPILNKHFATLSIFRWTVLSYPFLYFAVPYLTLLPDSLRMVCVYAILVWKVTAQAFAFPAVQIMIVRGAPHNKVLGMINGAAASSASLSRAIGPTVSGIVQSAGLNIGMLGLPWWINAAMALVGALISRFLINKAINVDTSEKSSDSDTEPLLAGQSDDQDTPELPNAGLETLQAICTSPTLERRGSAPFLR